MCSLTNASEGAFSESLEELFSHSGKKIFDMEEASLSDLLCQLVNS